MYVTICKVSIGNLKRRRQKKAAMAMSIMIRPIHIHFFNAFAMIEENSENQIEKL